MPEIPPEKSHLDKQKKDTPDEASWGEDQKRHDYYYDDSHGYEVYVPDEEEDAESLLIITDDSVC